MANRQLFIRSGDASAAGYDSGYDVAVTPESAGWDHAGLHVLTLPAGGSADLAANGDERLVVPLSGAVVVTLRWRVA